MSDNDAINTATDYMKQHGWYIRHVAWEYDHRHLDIVCIDGDATTVVFVEVINNGHQIFTSQDDIMVTAGLYVRFHHIENIPIRFDRITITKKSDSSHSVKHREEVRHVDPYYFYDKMHDRQRIQNIILRADAPLSSIPPITKLSLIARLRNRLRSMFAGYSIIISHKNSPIHVDSIIIN